MPDLTPETLAELRRLYSEWQETVKPYGFRLMPSGEYYALAAAAVNALPVLLAAAAERDALAAKVAAVRALHGPCPCEVCGPDPSCESCDCIGYPCPTIRALDDGDES